MAEDMAFLPKAEVLSLEELDRVCSAFVRQGVRKLRLTGGEPLVRRDIMKLFRSEEHTSELQSLMRISYAVFCLKKKTDTKCTLLPSRNSSTTTLPSTAE